MKTILYSILLTILFSFFIGCENNKENGNDENTTDTQESTEITESDVVGFYTGRGLYNAADATIELYYGGSFEMEDPFLPDGGPAFGKWVLRDNSIDFYMNGQKTFSASIVKRVKTVSDVREGTGDMKVKGIILNGQVWEKIR